MAARANFSFWLAEITKNLPETSCVMELDGSIQNINF